MTNGTGQGGYRKNVVHIIVGHGLRTYFLNAVRSLQKVAPTDDILVFDNASPDKKLRRDLAKLANEDPRMRLFLRDSNDLTNGKVGGLYDAYREAFEIATREDFDYVHLVQGDMQVLWWDSDVVARAEEIYASDPRCVNISMVLLSTDRGMTHELEVSDSGEPPKIVGYGLTDTGLFHMRRWKEFAMRFDNDELEHAKRYLGEGFSVICHPWPTDAQIPWPAVVRNGIQSGREITPVKPFLLKPMSATEVTEMKSRCWTWCEDVCIPWGWTCMTPMCTTHPNPAYLAGRRQSASQLGIRKSLPGWERRGLDSTSWILALRSQHRPSLWKLFIVVPCREMKLRLWARWGWGH